MARKTKAEAQLTRESILDAAEQLFFAQGVMKTTLEEIAEKAGVTRGAVYWHFDGKLAVFNAMHERVRLPQEEMLARAAVEGHDDPLGFIRSVVLDCFKAIETDERLMRVYTILLVRCEYVGEMIEVLNRQRDANEAMRENFTRMFEMAHKDGSLSSNWSPETAARVFESMLTGLWTDWLRNGQGFPLYQTTQRCITALLGALRAIPA